MPHFARNIVVGFARLGGRTIGIVGNQPAFLAGVLDIDASDKAAFHSLLRLLQYSIDHVRGCAGLLAGLTQEHAGVIRHGSKNCLRLCGGHGSQNHVDYPEGLRGAYIVMASKPTGADINLAYPMAEIAVMGAEGAVNILYRKANDEEKKQAIHEYTEKFSNPYRAAEQGFIDEVIQPRDTCFKLIQALEMAKIRARVILLKTWKYSL